MGAGWGSLRTALAGSLNVPAVRALVLVGTKRFVERLRALGFAHLSQDGDYYGYSLALGSAEVTLWELVNAYRSLLANDGVSAVLTLRPRPAPARLARPGADPDFPATPYIYVLYTYDGDIDHPAPRWGTPGAWFAGPARSAVPCHYSRVARVDIDVLNARAAG